MKIQVLKNEDYQEVSNLPSKEFKKIIEVGPNNKTQRSIFVNDTSTYTNNEGQTLPTRQSLSKALTPKADN